MIMSNKISASDRYARPGLFSHRIAAYRTGIGNALSDNAATDARLVWTTAWNQQCLTVLLAFVDEALAQLVATIIDQDC